MMNDVITSLLAKGIKLRLEGGKIQADPIDKLTPQDREAILSHRDDLIWLLTPGPIGLSVEDRRRAMGDLS